MNFCGIICEFNPFHNGHKYIIEEAKKQTGCDVVCLMSGDFVQRGIPAISDKYTRAKIAIENGASAVLELPTIFACSNAENFASGAVKILSALGTKYLAFGVENTDLEILLQIAKLKAENSERFQTAFKNETQNGINFNTALKRSIAKTLGDKDGKILEILNAPNNILAIEYLTAIIKQKSKLLPIAIKRCDNGYESYNPLGKFVSASAIREMILNKKDYLDFVPKNAKVDYYFNKNHSKTLGTLQILKIKQSSPKQLETLYDYTEGIEFRVKEMVEKYQTLDEINEAISTPRYRKPRVNKLLLYPLLGIKKQTLESVIKSKLAVKVLAIKNKELLSHYSKSRITLIATNKDYETLSKTQKECVDIDLNASTIYNTIFAQKNIDDKKIGTMFF